MVPGMTHQGPEDLWFEGRRLHLWHTPLESYLNTLQAPPSFVMQSTALLRGYVGSWRIDDHGTLWLVDLDGIVEVIESVPAISGWVGVTDFGRRGTAELSGQAGFVDVPPWATVLRTRPERTAAFTLDDDKFVVCVPAEHEDFCRSTPDLIVHTEPGRNDYSSWARLNHGLLRSAPVAGARWVDRSAAVPMRDALSLRIDVGDVEAACGGIAPWVTLVAWFESIDVLPDGLNDRTICRARADPGESGRLRLSDLRCSQPTGAREDAASVLFAYGELPMPATWFTGMLRASSGASQWIARRGFAVRNEAETLIQVKGGQVVSVAEIHNELPGTRVFPPEDIVDLD